eukprot:gene13277-28117_t
MQGMTVVLLFVAFILNLSLKPVHSYCHNQCSGHGTCGENDKCACFKARSGDVAWTGADCSERTCPKGVSWIGPVHKANDVHPVLECSNKGLCDRQTGLCECFANFDGVACERTVCPNDCSGAGICYTQRQLAEEAGQTYTTPWDADKQVGCVCDLGRRGPDCSLIECPSGSDILKGPGNESGRECSGRGMCDYTLGVCSCFSGFFGTKCQHQLNQTEHYPEDL